MGSKNSIFDCCSADYSCCRLDVLTWYNRFRANMGLQFLQALHLLA
jgi:hypothetical protein